MNIVTDGSSGAVPAAIPAAEAGKRGSSHWMAATLLGVTLLLFSRQAVFFLRPQFWAEDAAVLFLKARMQGWHSLFTPYPAYYILAQRLVACLAARLPALWVPAVYCYAALAYTLLTAWFCLRARLDHLMDRHGRIALALALVLVPQDGEILMNLIGSQWVLMAILLVLILQDAPATRGEAVVDFLGLLLAGMTGPYIVLYAPWFLVRLRGGTGGRSRYNLLLIGAAWCLAGVQFRAMLHGPFPQEPFTRNGAQWLKALGFTLPGGLFFGNRTPHYLGRAFYVISPALLLLFGWALWRGESKRLWATLALCGCGATAYAGGLRTLASRIAELDPFTGGSRYFYPFYLFSMWAAIIYCFDPAGKLRAAARLALLLMLLAAASQFDGFAWPDLSWKQYVAPLDAGAAEYGVPVLPNWRVDFPARR